MKKRVLWIVSLSVLIATLVGCMVSCTPNQTNQTGQEEGTRYVDYRSPQFHSHEELLQARIEAIASGHDPHKLEDVEFYYMSAYIETWCTLNHFLVSGFGVSVVCYDLVGSEPIFGYDFTLQAWSGLVSAEDRLAYTIEEENCKPWTVEGIYYYDVNNKSVFEELPNFRNFYWICDDWFFQMFISTELLECIEQNDPEAFQGRIFEVIKVYL